MKSDPVNTEISSVGLSCQCETDWWSVCGQSWVVDIIVVPDSHRSPAWFVVSAVSWSWTDAASLYVFGCLYHILRGGWSGEKTWRLPATCGAGAMFPVCEQQVQSSIAQNHETREPGNHHQTRLPVITIRPPILRIERQESITCVLTTPMSRQKPSFSEETYHFTTLMSWQHHPSMKYEV